jgi:hypothetical protein
MPTYVVECYWPRISKEQAEKALAAISHGQRTTSTLRSVYPLGCKGLARVLTTHEEQASPSNHTINIPTEGSSNGTEKDRSTNLPSRLALLGAGAPQPDWGPMPSPT